MYTAKDLEEVRKVISKFITPIELINDGLVIICDASILDDIGDALYHMNISQKNLNRCYEGCAQDVFVGKRKNGLQDRNN